MAAPATCVITYPTEGLQISAAPADETATFSVTGTTDPLVTVQINITGDANRNTTTMSSESGSFDWPVVDLPVGSYTVGAVAGDDPDTTDSVPVNFEIVAASLPPGASDNLMDATWYANWLAGYVTDIGAAPPLTFDYAICSYRGESIIDVGVIGALNKWAGWTDPGLWRDQTTALQKICFDLGMTDTASLLQWTDSTCMQFICQNI